MYYNARWYDPSLGRFAQADALVPGGVQGYDRYAYVNNDPVRYTDPSGHKPCWATSHYSCKLSQEIADREYIKYSTKDKSSVTAFFISRGFMVNPERSSTENDSRYNTYESCRGLRCINSIRNFDNETLSSGMSSITQMSLLMQGCQDCAGEIFEGILHLGEGGVLFMVSVVATFAVLGAGPAGLIAAPSFIVSAAVGLDLAIYGGQQVFYGESNGTGGKPDPIFLIHLFFPDYLENK